MPAPRPYRVPPAIPSRRRDDDDAQWTVADGGGRVLARHLTLTQLRARIENGLLPDATLIAGQNDRSWRPLAAVIAPSGVRRLPSEWYVACAGSKPVGPVDLDRVRRGILAERVPTDALVCRVGESQWQSLYDVPELADAIDELSFESELTGLIDIGS